MNLYDLSHPSKKKKQQLAMERRLAEFAPPGGDDNGPDEDEILFKLAKQWWLGSEQDMIRVERTLASMGWEIGEDEGSYDDGGVFVVRAGDENGRSYQSWPHEELSLDEAAPGWLRHTAGAATGALAGVGASFPGAAIAGPVGGAVAGAYGAKAGYDLGAGAADWVYDKVTGKRVPADKAEVDEELTMKHQRDHSTQRRPDISNSLADRGFDMSEKPNVAKSADGHPTVKWRHHGHAGHSRVEPTLKPTTVNRKDTRPIPSFLKKGVAESNTNISRLQQRIDNAYSRIYNRGDNGLEYMMGHDQYISGLMDRYLDDTLFAASNPKHLKLLANSLETIANDMEEDLEDGMYEQGVAESDLGNVAGYYKETQDIKKLTNWLEKNAGLPRNSPLYFDDVDLVYGNKTIVPGALVNPKLTFNDLLTAVVQALKQGVAEGGYQHGFADPAAPSLGGSRRKDDEGNLEFDDRQRRQTGMIFYKVDDTELAQQLGLKQTRTGKWYLRTGNRHAQQTADRAFGLGRIWYPESVEEAGVFGFMSNEPEKPVVKKPKFTLSQIRDMSKQEDEKTARYVRSNDLPKNPNHMRVVHDDVELGELSNKLLGKYKRELGVRASAADRAGDFDKGHEYFKKINRATIRQGENDARRHAEKEKENDVMETRLNMMRKAGYDL